MIQVARWKVILVVLATVLGILFSLPNLLPQKTLDQIPKWIPAKHLNLGLDLRGGAYLQLSVDTAQLKKSRLVNLAEDIRSNLRTNQLGSAGLVQTGDSIVVTVSDPTQMDAAFKVVSDAVRPPAGQTRGADLTVARRGVNEIVATYRPEALAAETAEAVSRSKEILRRRIDPDGTKEITITSEGTDRIVLQAPGYTNPDQLKEMVGHTAHLTFQMVDDSVSLQDAESGLTPPGSVILPFDKPQYDGATKIVVHRRKIIDGNELTNATFEFNEQGQPAVGLQFNGEGARAFGAATSANVGKRFAIILDDQVIEAPSIRVAITGGRAIIDGGFTAESAQNLSTLLKAGALPATLTVEDSRATTAELGQDAVNAGKISIAIGFAAIVVFMILSYGLLFGGVSVIGLLLNLILMVAILSLNQAALTLPGIAGLILTLAVAVDANVLIYERIRDEERAGQSPLMAMETGFKRASVSILDANVTTLISGVIMFMVAGSGPVKGFAWTLSVGVITSVFTAMLVSQVLLGWWFRTAKPKQLPI